MEITSIRDQILVLLEQVPRPPDTLLPRGATEEELAEFENSVGLFLPLELKEWLRTCNGPCVGPGGIYGISPAPKWLTIEAHLELVPEWKEMAWIPIAGDGVGNAYVLDTNVGSEDEHPVYFLDHETSMTEPVYIVASNLWQFLLFLLQTEWDHEQGRQCNWPFNAAKVLVADPGLEKYRKRVPLPWD